MNQVLICFKINAVFSPGFAFCDALHDKTENLPVLEGQDITLSNTFILPLHIEIELQCLVLVLPQYFFIYLGVLD